MRVLTWNVNGLRAVLNRRFGNTRNLLQYLKADIICLQETKLSKVDMTRFQDLALSEGWDSYFSFCTLRGGYSGVATYCNTETAQPLAAETGMCGTLPLPVHKPGMGSTARICFPSDGNFWQRLDHAHLEQIDNQGRCMITDHGAFVLFNVYGPAVTNEEAERFAMKLTLYEVLQQRLTSVLEAGRNVVLVGDLNIAPHMLDHCDWCYKIAPAAKAQFLQHRPDRQWFQQILVQGGGPLADVFRQFHPDRKAAYTVWNQKTGARSTNYGSRVDFILAAGPKAAASGTAPEGPAPTDQAFEGDAEAATGSQQDRPFEECCTASDLWTECQGSDHCPVWADFDVPATTVPQNFHPPALSTSHMFRAGGSSTLTGWLATGKLAAGSRGRKRARAEEEDTPPRPSLDDLEHEDRRRRQEPFDRFARPRDNTTQQPQASHQQPQQEPKGSMHQPHGETSEPSDSLQQPKGRLQQPQGGLQQLQGSVQQATSADSAAQGSWHESAQQHRTPVKPRKGQSSMTSFLTTTPDSIKPAKAAETEHQPSLNGMADAHQHADLHDAASGGSKQSCPAVGNLSVPQQAEQQQQQPDQAQQSQQHQQQPMTPGRDPPRCSGHDEPCQKKRVSKSGPNKGRYFYMCPCLPAAGHAGQCKTFYWADTWHRAHP